jgi:hypothetical protein
VFFFLSSYRLICVATESSSQTNYSVTATYRYFCTQLDQIMPVWCYLTWWKSWKIHNNNTHLLGPINSEMNWKDRIPIGYIFFILILMSMIWFTTIRLHKWTTCDSDQWFIHRRRFLFIHKSTGFRKALYCWFTWILCFCRMSSVFYWKSSSGAWNRQFAT